MFFDEENPGFGWFMGPLVGCVASVASADSV